MSRHLCRVPFENVSKLLLFGREGAGRPTTVSEFLDGIEHYDLGGTCYTSNPFLAELLAALGYDTDLLGADMSAPNVHTVIRVRMGGVNYHVDVGFAAPFREPMRFDEPAHEIADGDERFVVENYSVTVFSGRERLYGYVAHDPPRSLESFSPIILDSYSPGQTFMSCLRITRFFEDHTAEIRNTTLIQSKGGESRQTTLNSLAELESAVAHDLAMPRCPIEQAVAVLERVTGKPLFD
ncbi:MAG: arylamine N-acetyltransferase [Acidobacteriia bacterium]|nr:arylamine N-acetyltransferase [Terriglobia bacterium]